jgi:hypothetical protein
MKKAVVILVGVLAILLVLSFIKDMIVKTSVEKGVELVTGLRLNIRSMNVGILRTLVGIKNLRLFNPEGFKEEIMLDMPEIYVDYNLPAIIRGKVHLEEMRLNLKEFTVVKNEKGELNLDSLKVVQAQKEGKKPAEKEAKMPEMQIDSLELKVGKVIYKDYSRGRTPSVREFNLNLDEKYENITDPYSLVSLIVVKSLMNTTIARLTDFDLRGLEGSISDTLASAQKVAEEAAVETKRAIEQTTQRTQEATKQAADTIKKTTEGLKDTFKLPFGSDK